jgi:sulfate transport system substrate-binding protein
MPDRLDRLELRIRLLHRLREIPMNPTRRARRSTAVVALGLGLGVPAPAPAAPKSVALLNVSYDPTRELWRDLNAGFIARYQRATGARLAINQSHGGSSSQARAVIDGLDADVVTLASIIDTDAISRRGLIAPGWVDRLPHRSLPYYSTIVFVVRKGNPKGVRDWPDLLKPGVTIVTPNPKTSANGYLTFFAAWGSVVLRGGSRQAAEDYVARLYQRVPVLDSGARGATTTFAQRGIGDVHLAWENEALLEVREAEGGLDIVYPPISIRAEPHVAVVDANVDRRKTRAAAEAYLTYLYSDQAQEIIARHHYRPINQAILKRHGASFPDVKLFAVTEIAASFQDAHRQLIAEGGRFDAIYKPRAGSAAGRAGVTRARPNR